LTVLRAAPFSLTWGSHVYAQIQAINVVGVTPRSQAGNGAIIVSVPSAPTGLSNVPQNTTGSQIGLTWSAPIENGGSAILDYKVYYD